MRFNQVLLRRCSLIVLSSAMGCGNTAILDLANQDLVAPSAVTQFKASAGTNQISLRWVNPADKDFKSVRIVRKTGAYPSSQSDGAVIYEGGDTSAIDANTTNLTEYYYSAYAVDSSSNLSAPAKSKSASCSASIVCPSGYILIGANEAVNAYCQFCVAQYEMKNVAGVATFTLGGISWIKRNSLKRFITGEGNGLEGAHGLSIWDRMRNTGESLATKVNANLEKRRTEHEGQHVDLASQERRKRLRELSIRYVQDTAVYSSFPLHSMSFSHILMAVFALCLGCYALLSVVTLMGLISDRQIDTGFWLLVLLQIPGAILPIGIFIFTFIAKAGFNVVNLVRYYLFFRGIDLVIIFVLFKYPSLRRALGERLSERYEFVAFAINLLIAVGIFMLFALYYSRSKRVKVRYGQYLKFGEGGSIFGIFPNVVRVTEEEASQLVSMIPTQAGGSSPTASGEFIDRSGHENKND